MQVPAVVFLLYLTNLGIPAISAAYGPPFSDIHWTTSIKLSEYNGYKSVTLLSFNIPEQTTTTIWNFQSQTSDSNCPIKEVIVYFQHGSYPVISPYNETFPDSFYVNRTGLQHGKVHTTNVTKPFIVPSPRPGTWYVAAFLPRSNEDKPIRSKVFKERCLYGLFVNVASHGLYEVEEISLSRHYHLSFDLTVDNRQQIFRFAVPVGSVSYSAIIKNCTVDKNGTLNNVTSCPVLVTTETEAMPSSVSIETDCSAVNGTCRHDANSPKINKWTYLVLKILEDLTAREVRFTLNFDLTQCVLLFSPPHTRSASHNFLSTIDVPKKPKHSIIDVPPEPTNSIITNTTNTSNSTLYFEPNDRPANHLPDNVCILIDSLGRLGYQERDYDMSFLLPDNPMYEFPLPMSSNRGYVPDERALVTSFTIQEEDLGGTLKLGVDIYQKNLKPTQAARVWMCVMKDAIPAGNDQQLCSSGALLHVNTTDYTSDKVYIPYPETGLWHITFISQCFSKNTSKIESCGHTPLIEFDVMMTQCVDSQCGRYGSCKEYISGVHVFSACVCYAGWRGYGCTDGSEANSDASELAETLLLVLSNLFFIPGICLSLYRRYFVEALVYFFNMFFSVFYHACDSSKLYQYCMMKYSTLQYSDFFASILSFWVTILAMAKVPDKVRSFLHMLGVLAMAVVTEVDLHGIWGLIACVGVALVIMTISWMWQCRKYRHCFPPRRWYLTNFLPGVVLAGTGLCLFTFVETQSNYRYVHSVWHVCMSTCIIFFLPKRENKSEVDSDGDTTQLIDQEEITAAANIQTPERETNSRSPNHIL